MATTVKQTTTPNGTAGLEITCTCRSHKTNSGRAIIRDAEGVREALTADLIHGNVLLAHHPVLSRSANVRKLGPWAA